VLLALSFYDIVESKKGRGLYERLPKKIGEQGAPADLARWGFVHGPSHKSAPSFLPCPTRRQSLVVRSQTIYAQLAPSNPRSLSFFHSYEGTGRDNACEQAHLLRTNGGGVWGTGIWSDSIL